MLLLPWTIHSFISLKLCDYAVLLKEKHPFPNILSIMWREGCELASKHQKYKHSSFDCAHLALFGFLFFFFFKAAALESRCHRGGPAAVISRTGVRSGVRGSASGSQADWYDCAGRGEAGCAGTVPQVFHKYLRACFYAEARVTHFYHTGWVRHRSAPRCFKVPWLRRGP